MQIHKFKEFVLTLESSITSSTGIIGDSHVGLYTKLIPQLITFDDGGVKLNVGGWSSSKLLDGCKKYNRIHPEISVLFIKIGDNDVYQVNLAEKNAPLLKKELTRIFPNAQRFVVIKGSWGWGGLSRFQSETEPAEFTAYYDVFKKNGFEVTSDSQGKRSNKESHIIHDGIRSQSNEINQIIKQTSVGNGPITRLSPEQLQDVDTTREVDSFYSILQNSISKNESCMQQSRGSYEFSNLVRCIQIGLNFLGYELPKYGVDGLYGPETAASIDKFKSDYDVEGPSNVFTPQDTQVLMNTLKSKNFSQQNLEKVWDVSQDLAGQVLANVSTTGGMDFLYYLPHQQGPAGCSRLILAVLGQGKLHPNTRANNGKYLTANCHLPEVRNQIKLALRDDNDQAAATLFLNYQKDLWNKKVQTSAELIQKPEKRDVKEAIDSIPTKLPKSFLYTVATVESGLKADSNKGKNKKYSGLFAVTREAVEKEVRKAFPNETPDIFNPKHNALTGVRSLEKGISYMINTVGAQNLAQLGIKADVNVA